MNEQFFCFPSCWANLICVSAFSWWPHFPGGKTSFICPGPWADHSPSRGLSLYVACHPSRPLHMASLFSRIVWTASPYGCWVSKKLSANCQAQHHCFLTLLVKASPRTDTDSRRRKTGEKSMHGWKKLLVAIFIGKIPSQAQPALCIPPVPSPEVLQNSEHLWCGLRDPSESL